MLDAPASVEDPTTLSMTMPLVPPASGAATAAKAPTFVHVHVLSAVVIPAVPLNGGVVPPETQVVP